MMELLTVMEIALLTLMLVKTVMEILKHWREWQGN